MSRVSHKDFNKRNESIRQDLNHFIEKYNDLAAVVMGLYQTVEELKANGNQTKSKVTSIINSPQA